MRRIKYFFSVFLFLCCITEFDLYANERSAQELLREADRALRNNDLYNAIDFTVLAWKKDSTDVEIAYQAARLNYSARDYHAAKRFFKIVYEQGSDEYPNAAYLYARMLKMSGNCHDAMPLFEITAQSYIGPDRRFYRNAAQAELDGCKLAENLMGKPLNYAVTDPGKAINTPYSNISPLWMPDGKFIYATLDTDTVISVNPRSPAGHHLQFYVSQKVGETYSEAEHFSNFNTPDAHVANGALSPDSQRFYFTKCREDKHLRIRCRIYRSDLINGEWKEAKALPRGVNHPDFTQTQPTIGFNSRGREVLYFVSDREGGRGGLDIWFSIINPDGTYRDAMNAGPAINTEQDEVTPWFDPHHEVLYFSSNGHPGIGGFDVFKTTGEMRRWSSPENLGLPFNSAQDDMYFKWQDSTGKKAVIVSNRPGETPSLRGPTCCDHIYFLNYQPDFFLAVKGRVFDYDKPEKGPLVPSPVWLSYQNQEDALARDTTAGEEPYFFVLNEKSDFRITGSHEGYLSASSTFETQTAQNRDTLEVNIYLRKLEIGRAYRLENVYYDFDKWDLRPESKETLDTLYRIMVENPQIVVELSSHTDQRGSVAYNNVLSQRRAESCMRYLIQQGIDRERLQARGYGKSRILEDCSIYPDCPMDSDEDCPCHQMNRRTEFTVVGELDGELIYDDVRYGDN